MTFDGLNPPYATIVADPPWRYRKSSQDRVALAGNRTAEDQFSTMEIRAIAKLPVGDLADNVSCLYLWTTNPRMFGDRNEDGTFNAYHVMEAWGFAFKTILTWVKTGPPGMGSYFRGNTEHVLFGTRGDFRIGASEREPNVITAARGRHSQKPPAFFDLVERVSPAPRLELFARQPRLGWDHWGYGIEGAA